MTNRFHKAINKSDYTQYETASFLFTYIRRVTGLGAAKLFMK